MYGIERLKIALHSEERSRLDSLLLCLGVDPEGGREVRELREIAVRCGVRGVRKWNISDILADAPRLAIRADGKWELTPAGRHRVSEFASVTAMPLASRTAPISNTVHEATRSPMDP